MSNREYQEKGEKVGKGAMWVKETRNGAMLSGTMEFQYNGHPVTTKFIAFKNQGKKENNRQPDWNIFVEDAFPTLPKPLKGILPF